jgi:hypothetical protein
MSVLGMDAVYYPYSRCISDVHLKYSLLLFRTLTFVDPLEDYFREFLLFSDKGCQYVPVEMRERWRKAKDIWDFMQDHDAVRFVDPVPLLQDHNELITAHFATDMKDPAFQEAARLLGKAAGPWKMLASRVPPGINKIFEDKLGVSRFVDESFTEGSCPDDQHEFSQWQQGVFAWEHYDHFGLREYTMERLGGRKSKPRFERLNPQVRNAVGNGPLSPDQLLFISGAGTCTESGEPFGSHPYDYVKTVSDPRGEKIRIFSFEQGSSIALTQALLVAELEELVPFTDSPAHERLLALRYNSAVKAKQKLQEEPLSIATKFQQKKALLGKRILSSIIAPDQIARLSAEQIWKFREANRENLERFWTKIGQMCADISTLPRRQ